MSLAALIAEALARAFLTTRVDIFETARVEVPGIGTGAAYAAGDQMGTLIRFDGLGRVPGGSGYIVKAIFYDPDDEGLPKTLHLFTGPVTLAGDNNAYSLDDAGLLRHIGDVEFSVYSDHVNGQTAVELPALEYTCAPNETALYGAVETDGADNLALIPSIRLWAERH